VLHAMEHSRCRRHTSAGSTQKHALGRPAVIMDLVEGVCDGFVLNGSRPLERRLDIAQHLYDYLAEIHRFDWRAHGLDKVLEDPGAGAATAAVEHWSESCGRCNSNPNRNWKSCSPGCDHTRLGPRRPHWFTAISKPAMCCCAMTTSWPSWIGRLHTWATRSRTSGG